MVCFLRLTHDRYYEHLAEFFGTTIIAMFTDEPQVMGRNPLRPADPRPFTPGLIEWLAERWGDAPRPWLPALWEDYGPGTANACEGAQLPSGLIGPVQLIARRRQARS